MSRKIKFVDGEYYHIYNRGTDKRDIFLDQYDIMRFFQSMDEFNVIEPIGSIYVNFQRKNRSNAVATATALLKPAKKLVDFVCYNLNPNHYHFILTPVVDKGIEKFMHKLALGYAHYFNNKYERSGVLFQGPFKAIHIDSNEYLLYLSAYVNLNNKIHQLGSSTPKLSKSSWEEYVGRNNKEEFCEKGIVLSQFKNKKEYKEFAEDSLKIIKENKEMKKFLLE